MKRKLMLTVATCATLCTLGQNPIVSHCYTADPAPAVFVGNDSLYFYCDEDMNVPGVNDYYYMERWRVYSTVDMVNWTDHGIAMPRTAFAWADEGSCWASQCVEHNGKYYWYMCASKPNSWIQHIGVGVSDKPSGPFKDARRQPVISTGTGGDIDPTVFIDDDGSRYIYWGNNKLCYAMLGTTMLSINTRLGEKGVVSVPLTADAFGGVKKDGKVDGADCYEEGPWLDKRGSTYYLLYAAGGVPEHISYSTSDSPRGPWTYRGQLMTQQATNSFTNHCGMVRYKGRDYFFYHTGWAQGGGGFNRSTAVEEMHINEATGEIAPITATREGVAPLCTMNPYIRQQAETLNAGYGVSVVGNESTGVYVTDIHYGDSMRVANVDFGEQGAKSITIKTAKAAGKGYLVIRLDSSKGKTIARIPLAVTGSDAVWEENTYDLMHTPTGVHNLHFSFVGSATGGSTIFNWDWWQFNDWDTAIDNITTANGSASPLYYTLQGTPVDQPSKGLYIRGGKKVMVP